MSTTPSIIRCHDTESQPDIRLPAHADEARDTPLTESTWVTQE
ncbi:hypothetical protein [Allorhodopirellula heiligendammensis]|nr:hypothetical protein [Allorhodopirellula heiligendammensis]